MAYCVNFEGEFVLDRRMPDVVERAYRKHGDDENWPDAPDDRFNPWDLSKDGLRLTVETDKSGDWKAWLQYTIDRWLAPHGIAISGSVKWDGEERGDAGVITVEGGKVKARAKKPPKPWAELPPKVREHVIDKIQEAMSDDRYGRCEDAWLAALTALGHTVTSDRTKFDP